jgi:transcriptional regulator with XRE-family HTH domain
MFSDNLTQFLHNKNITAYKLAKDIGISNGIISAWKNSASLPSGENLLKIANYLGCSIDELLGREVLPQSPQERALEAYLALPTNERKAFIQEAIKHI